LRTSTLSTELPFSTLLVAFITTRREHGGGEYARGSSIDNVRCGVFVFALHVNYLTGLTGITVGAYQFALNELEPFEHSVFADDGRAASRTDTKVCKRTSLALGGIFK